MGQSKHAKKRIIEGKKMSNVMTVDEMYDPKKTYINGQMLLKNRSFKPYPSGNGGVDSADCKKHDKHYTKIFREQEKRHSLAFWARVRADEKKNGIKKVKPLKEKIRDYS